ncbi:alpha-glucosidase [Chitinophaga terrae (ex Kim and Jung 2007)]|uniref:Alpha-glucosidase n=1 Tax=Chitinophaga terrae (ex Kim and Jung 2007) TaxID=408074 RepID=A0A1H4G371_9BACT|nr:TIM-barrel domain-containing protein [Chitinophaga terrae (ex Kim and Jung 2007)]GEP92946.1 alpha-glucosidase [Chitinophaga terrae (ex Kim and Jung 2007)]SEB04053.1 alpha-glucosidase [Chitinophaga terrae (ex Kim and Jung 2007)]
MFKKYKSLCLKGLLVLFCLKSGAQSPVRTIGNVKKVDIAGQQIKITAENAYAEITVYSPTITRVRIDKQPLGPDFSYAVIANPLPTKIKTNQSAQSLVVATDSLQVEITKTPFSIRFLTIDGQVINEDERGLTTSWVGDAVTSYKTMQEGERFIGLGEKVGNLDRRNEGYTNWNSDKFGYATNVDPLYATIPFYIGIHHQLNYGIFFDNTWQSDFNFGASNNRFSSFGARNGEMNYYFIYHQTLAGIISSYTSLTGRMPLPPKWSLGYQQNRYSYYPDVEVMRVAQTLREKKIPSDGITLDIHYMDSYKLFTWNKERFPNPKQLSSKLADMGYKLTVIVDPGIKVEDGYAAYESGKQSDIFIKYPDGKYYTGQVWPGWCHFPDFTGTKGRQWWKTQIKGYTDAGVNGIWNDMNEIATWGQKMPDNVLFNMEGHPASHLQAHNIYGLQMTRASYEGARENMNKRPFLLTRAAYAGSQRYTAIWTGDNRAEDDHMLLGVRLLNSLGVSGMPFAGMDIGGFTGNPTVGLYTRWMQVGAFIPYYRNHTQVNTKSAEPWAFGEEALEITRNYINLRYRLLPYLYSNMAAASRTGVPVMRTLAIDNTFDPSVYDTRFQNQFEFGNAFMIAPFESTKEFGQVYFPAGKWYSLYTDKVFNGKQEQILSLSFKTLPVFVKGSSIIPMQSLTQSTVEKPADTLYLHVYRGDQPNTFVYYEDDGESFDYEKGGYYQRSITYDPAKKQLQLDKVTGSYSSNFRYVSLLLHGFEDMDKISVNGKGIQLQKQSYSFLSPISRFDPQGAYFEPDRCAIQQATFENGNQLINVDL